MTALIFPRKMNDMNDYDEYAGLPMYEVYHAPHHPPSLHHLGLSH